MNRHCKSRRARLPVHFALLLVGLWIGPGFGQEDVAREASDRLQPSEVEANQASAPPTRQQGAVDPGSQSGVLRSNPENLDEPPPEPIPLPVPSRRLEQSPQRDVQPARRPASSKTRAGGELRSFELGVSMSATPNAQGVLVKGVIVGGAAERAGIRPGDVLLAVNGQEVQFPEDVFDHFQQTRPDESTTLDIWRRGEQRTVQVDSTATAASSPRQYSNRPRQDYTADDHADPRYARPYGYSQRRYYYRPGYPYDYYGYGPDFSFRRGGIGVYTFGPRGSVTVGPIRINW